MNTRGDPNAVRVECLGKAWEGHDVLVDVNLTVHQGETVAVIGPSGAGKTTLLRCVNFLIPYDSGRVYVGTDLIGYRDTPDGLVRRPDREVNHQRTQIGFVFQRFHLFPHRTALGNLMEGPVHVLRVPRAAAEERARLALTRVGLESKADAFPDELSGGQQQRVGIARALCMEPSVLLCDEITSALDPELVSEVLSVMNQLAADGMTMVVVTHEMRFAARVADRVVFMEDGRIVADSPARQFFSHPPTERIAEYLAEFTR